VRPGGAAAAAALADVVGRVTAARRELRKYSLEVIRIPVLVGVAEDEVEGSVERRHDLVRVAKPCVDELGQACRLEVGERLLVSGRIYLDRDQLAAGLAERPGDPDAGVPGRGADLERTRVAVLDDEVVQQLAIRSGHVQVASSSGTRIEEALHAAIERGLVAGLRAEVEGGEGHRPGERC